MARTDPDAPRDRQALSLWRRLDHALGELNPLLLAAAMGLVVLNLTCLAALFLPTSHLAACVTTAAPPAARPVP